VLRLSISRHAFLIPLLGVGLSTSACTDESSQPAEAGDFRNLEDDLELHWSFEDRVGNQITDLSGNGRHGTLNGGAFVSSPDGEAVSLDGVDDYVALTHLGLRAPSLYGGVSGDFTISARVRVADVNKLNTLCFGCGPFSAMYVGTAAYPAKVMTALFNQQTGGSLYPLSSAALVGDEWREVTLVVDGGGSARYYLDCAVDTELVNANIGLKDYNSSTVGRGAAADRWFGGEIDQLRVWSRALSEADIAELCPQTPPLEQGLQLHWSFEDHDGTEITDLSGNDRHGTLNGGAFVSSPNGEAVSLDGVDDYIAFTGPRSPAIYGGVDGDFTISARVRVDELNKFNTLCYGCGPSSTWFLGDEVHGGRTTAAFLNQSTNGTLWTASNPAMSEEQWTEVTMVVDGGTSVRNYFNCGLDSERLNSNVGLKDFGYSAVGLSANAARWFGGDIDELRVWDRALPEQEIALLCDACLGPIHVDVDAPSGGDGKSWATAFDNLQDAIDASVACGGSQIWVAEGTYAPDPNAPVATISAPVSIYGGFAGTETALAQRDFVAHPVQLGAPGWQSRVVVIDDGDVPQARLDGFTITGSEAGAILVEGFDAWVTMPTVFFDNLVITDNSADEGGGIFVPGSVAFEVTNSHFEGNVAAENGAAISFPFSVAYIDSSSFIDNEAPGGAITNEVSDFSDWSYLSITDSVLSGNVGGAIYAKHVDAENCEFSNNTAVRGAAIRVVKFSLAVHDCTFTGNHADYGGAIYDQGFWTYASNVSIFGSTFSGNTAKYGGAVYFTGTNGGNLLIEGAEFSDNSSTHGSGGAVWMNSCDTCTVDGASFLNNDALAGGGGAVYIKWGSSIAIDGSSFIGNTAPYGGAMQVDGDVVGLDVSNSRFVSNQALSSTGGAVRNLSADVSVTNTELVGNSSALHGGGFYGRATFTSSTFANNVAGGAGHGLFAPNGPAMTIRNVVAWPDNLSAASMILDHACVPQVVQTHTNIDSTFIAASPFAAADLDTDGLTEFYLAPASACVDIGGTVEEFDWSALTTQASQCTDVTPVDAGVHYAPQSAVGPCE
jgi:hypothetical protein